MARSWAGIRCFAARACRSTCSPSWCPRPPVTRARARVTGGEVARKDPGSFRCIPLVRSMLHRKRKKPLAGARSFPAVRHEPTNPNDGLARAGAADRQGVPLLGGEQPVGCALLSRKSLRQRIAAPLFFGLGLRDTADKTSDSRACRDAHPRWFPSSPSWSWPKKSRTCSAPAC